MKIVETLKKIPIAIKFSFTILIELFKSRSPSKKNKHDQIIDLLKKIDKKTDLLPIVDLKVTEMPRSDKDKEKVFQHWLKQLDKTTKQLK